MKKIYKFTGINTCSGEELSITSENTSIDSSTFIAQCLEKLNIKNTESTCSCTSLTKVSSESYIISGQTNNGLAAFTLMYLTNIGKILNY